ncbi:hypothetical protein PCO87_11445 [Pectobacteriaceae bacterium C52]|nr:hypothetical protein PCO87_11445 [Pectobacteriaceae bacterium C52]
MNTQSYSSEEKDVIKQVVSKYANIGIFIIQPNDPLLVRFYDIQLKLAGITKNNYPQFTQCWSKEKRLKRNSGSLSLASNSSAYPVYSIVGLDSKDGYAYLTSAIGSLPVSATNVTQTLGIFDGEANNVGTVQYSKTYVYTADCVVQANGTFSKSLKTSDYMVIVIYTFAQTIGHTTVFGAEILVTQSYPKEITNDSPTDINHNSEIKICLTRNETDCDYRHNYNNVVSVPIKGNISYFGNIDLSGGKPVSANNSIYLIRKRAGGDPITPVGDNSIFNSPNTRISGNTLSWDLDWLQFKKVDFESGEEVYYVFRVNLNVEGKSVVSFITNAPKSIEPEQRFLNTKKIKPMRIVYGCLGKDTRITMQDGNEKTIDNIIAGEFVRSQNGKILRVEDVVTGKEHQYAEITLQRTKNTKKKLICSLGHPICTSFGVVLARELSLSSELITQDGKCHIESIKQKEGEIAVYNLQLSVDDPTDDGLYGNNTLYANGVSVGDSLMQSAYEDEYYRRPVNVLSRLPAEWHQDYQNYIDSVGK